MAVKLQRLLAPTSNSKQHVNKREISIPLRPSGHGCLGANRLTGRLLRSVTGLVTSCARLYPTPKDRRHNDTCGVFRFSYHSSRNDKVDDREALQFVLEHFGLWGIS